MKKLVPLFGLVLIALGVVGLVWGGITYTRERNTAEFGPVKVRVTERESIPLPPVAGAICLLGGIVLVTTGTRGRKA